MSCFTPMQGWRSRNLNENGKRPFTTDRNSAFVDMPMTLPCGNCLDCRLRKSADWGIRMMHECKSHQQNTFITLTYSPKYLPKNGSLDPDHFPKFIRSLRKRTGKKIRYYQCGEYGEKLGRPHIHAVLFGYDFPDKKAKPKRADSDNQFYTSNFLEKVWKKGRCDISDVTFDSAAYVAGYITKKVNGDMAPIHYSSIDYETGEVLFTRIPESATMSTKPAIGYLFYKKYKHTAIFAHDRVIMKGKEFPVPKYYDKLYEKEHPELMLRIKAARKKSALERVENNPKDYTPERIEVKNWVKQLNFNTKVRKFEVNSE